MIPPVHSDPPRAPLPRRAAPRGRAISPRPRDPRRGPPWPSDLPASSRDAPRGRPRGRCPLAQSLPTRYTHPHGSIPVASTERPRSEGDAVPRRDRVHRPMLRVIRSARRYPRRPHPRTLLARQPDRGALARRAATGLPAPRRDHLSCLHRAVHRRAPERDRPQHRLRRDR